jgi:transposase
MPAPSNILNLSSFTVSRVDEDAENYHVYAEVASQKKSCPHCRSTDVIGWGAQEVLIRDLPMHGKRVGIYVRTRRLRCDRCGKTAFEKVPAVSEKRQMTERLVKWIGQQSLKRVFTSIAEETGVDEKTVRNIFRDYVTDLQSEVKLAIPRWLGIDEIHIIKKPRCVLANVEERTIVDILPNRNKSTVTAYLNAFEGRDAIKYVAMDMWTPYRDAAAAALPHATVVIDKFHVLRMANVAIEQVRKSLRAGLNPKERRGLMHDRFILLKREHELSAQERFFLENWQLRHPALRDAYLLKEEFFTIYDSESRVAAKQHFERWAAAIPDSAKTAFSPILTAWKNWEEPILAYFDHPITNAYTESLNNLIRLMNRLGRGYSFEALRAKILFTEGLRKTSRPKFERLVDGYIQFYAPDAPRVRPTVMRSKALSLGVDIPTLSKWLEEGRL